MSEETDMNLSTCVIEFLIQKLPDDALLDRLLATLPLSSCGSRIQKALLIRRIQAEVSKAGSKGEMSSKIMDYLELVGELDAADGKVASEKMREAYCSVAVDCAAKHLELEDYPKYGEVVETIWRERVQKLGERGGFGLVDEKTMAWVDDIEAAIWNTEIQGKIMSMSTRYEAIKAVRSYCAEANEEIGPSFVEKTAKHVVSMRRDGTREDATMEDVIGEEQRFEGLEEINVAHKSPGRPSDVIGEKQGYVDNVIEAHKEVAPGPSETAELVINTRRAGIGIDAVMEDVIGEEQRIEGLEDSRLTHKSPSWPSEEPFVDGIGEEQGFVEDVNEAHNEVAPSGRPSEKLSEAKIVEEQGSKGLGNVNEAAPCRPRERVSEDKIGEEGLKGSGNVNEAHNEVAPSGPCETLSKGKIVTQKGLKDSRYVNEARSKRASTGPCDKLSEDDITKQQGLKDLRYVNEARNEGASTGPCEKLSEDMNVKEKRSKRFRNVNDAHNEVAPSGPCDNFSKDKIVDKHRLKGLGSVNETCNMAAPSHPSKINHKQGYEHSENVTKARNDATPTGSRQKPSSDEIVKQQGLKDLRYVNMAHNEGASAGPCEKLSEGKNKEKQGYEHSENVTKARNDAIPSGSCQKPSAETLHKKHPKRQRPVSVHKKTSKAKLCDTSDLDKDTEYDKAKTDLESSFADLRKSVKDPLPSALKIAEQVSSDLNKNTDATGKHAGLSIREPLPEARKSPKRVSFDLNKGKNVAGSSNAGLNVGPSDHANQDLPNDPFEFQPSQKYVNRRPPKKWSIIEEETLRKGVEEKGRGNWKSILLKYHDVFEERTEVDLKDKWRNLTR